MNESTTASAPGAAAPPAPGRFGLWVRSLGLVRSDAWIGGVCSAIAHRIGVDPAIVRGVFVVATLFGFPGLWLYAIGWAFLPDETGRSPLGGGRADDPALFGVGITVFLAVVSTWAGSWLAGLVFGWPDSRGLADAVGAGLLPLAVVGGLVGLVLWLVRRPARSSSPGSGGGLGGGQGALADRGAAAGAVAPPFGEPSAGRIGERGATDIAGPSPEPATKADPEDAGVVPAALPADPSAGLGGDADFDAWRQQQEAWHQQHEGWREQQADADRVAREEERARRRAASQAFAEESARLRAERRASRPRISLAYGASTLGLALVLGAVTALVVMKDEGWPSPTDQMVASISGALLAAGGVAAAGMIAAGLLRRRSGALAFMTVVCTVVGGGTLFASVGLFGIASSTGYEIGAGEYAIEQTFGELHLAVTANDAEPGEADVRLRSGTTFLTVDPDVELDATLRLAEGDVQVVTSSGGEIEVEHLVPEDGVVTWRHTGDADTGIVRTIDVTQGSGSIIIQVQEETR
ncbi:PspC domain-containing protein [Microbacterium betulae]|uniref:PspC domain-containing protein n=1 Tax=Microbacterium betulae TaxID=2981139 RepID=A0AA97FIX9_9MICO|nr:PspC domain-containing protein [Microbacterium sp. AB]WOF23568.1 PspC domain-containing protein [Microbacterium sp. AB]